MNMRYHIALHEYVIRAYILYIHTHLYTYVTYLSTLVLGHCGRLHTTRSFEMHGGKQAWTAYHL